MIFFGSKLAQAAAEKAAPEKYRTLIKLEDLNENKLTGFS